MSNVQDSRAKHFWDQYIATIQESGIKPDACRWYVLRCEQFLRHNTGLRLKQHSADSVCNYFKQLGSESRLNAWQLDQAMHAIQLLFKMIRAPFYSQVDWRYWRASAQRSSKTPAKNNTSHHKTERIDYSISSNMNKKTVISCQLDQIRLAIRRLNYSIRTEKAYVDWAERFLRFHDKVVIEELSDSHIVAFIEYLAVSRQVAPATQSAALNLAISVILSVPNAEKSFLLY